MFACRFYQWPQPTQTGSVVINGDELNQDEKRKEKNYSGLFADQAEFPNL